MTGGGNALEPDELAAWTKTINAEELRNYAAFEVCKRKPAIM